MLWKLFVAALAIRWLYVIAMFALMGNAGLQSEDSQTYLYYAHEFAGQMASGSLSGWQWLGPLGDAMPLSQWLFNICALAFGASTPVAYVLLQGLFDAGTCLLIFCTARTLSESYAVPAGIAAAVNPTQIVLSGLVLTDTPFLFFVTLFLFAAVRWLRTTTWRSAVLIGFALGAATMTRALAAPFAAVLLLFLLAALAFMKILRPRYVAQLVVAAVICALCVAPVLWRNVSKFNAWSLTPQSGIHFALWVAPLVREAADGTPWKQSYDTLQHRVDERYTTPTDNPFEQSRRYQTIAREELVALGARAMAKAWLNGAAINLGSPGIILSPPVMQLPRTGFYATPGTSPLDKAKNFLFHSDNATYAWIILIGIAGVMAARLIQVAGAVVLLRQGGHLTVLCLFGLWIGYVLAINGPVASPKYRLPIEPPLMVLTGAGLSALLRARRQPVDHEHHAKSG
jgi:4-amino-4-deoxy-L-arabinose transferase-like glycosyltransferase